MTLDGVDGERDILTKTDVRRCFAFAGGCVVGIGLGGIADGINNAINWYKNYPNVSNVTAGPTIWLACIVVGVGLGIVAAATIRDNPPKVQDIGDANR